LGKLTLARRQQQQSTEIFTYSPASEYVERVLGVRCAPKWLSKMHSVGGGPKFQHFGRFAVYTPADLDRWVQDEEMQES
jgi:hypothetical protein